MASVTAPPPGIADPSRRTLFNPMMRDRVTFLAYSAETGGAYTRFHCRVAPGGGTPPHYHDTYTESFKPLVGTTTVYLNNSRFRLRPTTSTTSTTSASPSDPHIGSDPITVPIATNHYFANEQTEDEGDIEFEGELRPGSEGFEKSLHVLYGLARDGLCNHDGSPKGFVNAAMAFDMGDMRLPGLLWSVGMPVVKLTARFARWMGWERELVERYWC